MSIPLFQELNPKLIPWQYQAIQHFKNFNYKLGINEMVFSGSIGSSKSVCAVHLICRHVLENKGARALIVRRALKDLKRTIWPLILNHMSDIPHVIKSYNKSELKITLINGSEIIGDSYDDYNLEKFRSLELSMSVIEEATEGKEDVYDAIKMRLGRCIGVNQNIMLLVTNPDSPHHWIFRKLIDVKSPNRKIFYSLTEQNPFLPSWYLENLRRDLDQKMAQRMLYGQWVELNEERVYYAYTEERNYIDEYKTPIPGYPICLMHDFNIAAGKPMSAAIAQKIGDHYHIYKTFLIEGGRTGDMLDEIAEAGFLDMTPIINLYGDASGSHKDTRNNWSDWDIIMKFVKNYQRKDGQRLQVNFNVPKSNPPLRQRHNTANALFMNSLNQSRVTIYKGAKDASIGFRLTQLKKGAHLIEDDSLREQHVTTAITYMFDYEESMKPRQAVVLR